MRQPLARLLVAWLCLFAFGLDMMTRALGTVVCVSGSDIRLEWACEKDGRAECLAGRQNVDSEGGPAVAGRPTTPPQPLPCKDLPVDDDHDQGHHLLVQYKQYDQMAFTLTATAFTVLPQQAFEPPLRSVRTWPDAFFRPPDALCRLATIVMIV